MSVSNSIPGLILALCLTPAVAAQVTGVPPFAGAHFEGFEPPVDGAQRQCTSVRGFQATATICTPYSFGIETITTHALPAAPLSPRSGSRFLRVLDGFASGAVEIVFETPVRRFGGWFAVSDPAQVMGIGFYDDAGTLVGMAMLDTVSNGEWRWNGWELQGTAARRAIVSPNIEGFFFMDDLQNVPEGTPGSVYCVAQVNSTGSPARIFTTGSASLAAGDLVLHAAYVPEGQPGLFIYGPAPAMQPTQSGFLCVGSPARLSVAFTQGLRLSHPLDTSMPPGPTYVITPGSTWFFQAWFRDPAAGPPRFDWSDGLEIQFVP